MQHKRKYWTKDELKKFVKLWESKTVPDLAQDFGVSTSTIQGVAGHFRKAGYKLAYKRQKGSVLLMIKEVVKELK